MLGSPKGMSRAAIPSRALLKYIAMGTQAECAAFVTHTGWDVPHDQSRPSLGLRLRLAVWCEPHPTPHPTIITSE